MKKSVIILLLLICIFTLNAEMYMSFGLKGGISLNHMWGDDWDNQVTFNTGDNTFRLGFSVGGFVSVNISNSIALQPEVYLSLIGGGYDYTEAGSTIENTQRLWVLEIPILLKLTMPAGNFRGAVFAGGNIMIKMFDYTQIDDDQEDVISDQQFERPYFGLVGGIEMDIPMNDKMYFIVDVRYCLMLSDIFAETMATGPEMKSNSLKFMVGIGTGM